MICDGMNLSHGSDPCTNQHDPADMGANLQSQAYYVGWRIHAFHGLMLTLVCAFLQATAQDRILEVQCHRQRKGHDEGKFLDTPWV
jgi:hypothetical protein